MLRLQEKLEYVKAQYEIANYGRVESGTRVLIESGIDEYIIEGLYYKGTALSCQLMDKEALVVFDELVVRYPSVEKGYFERFEILRDTGAFERARKDADRIHLFDPTNPAYIYALIALETALKDYKAVISWCDKLLNLHPSDYDLLSHKADAHLVLGKYRHSISEHHRLLSDYELDEVELARIHNNIGYAHSRLGEFAKAKGYLKKANELYFHVYYLNNLGYVLFKLGEQEKGIEMIRESTYYDPSESYAYKYLGKVYLELGEMATAKKMLVKAKDLDSAYHHDDEVDILLRLFELEMYGF